MTEASRPLPHNLLARQVKRHSGLDGDAWPAVQQELEALAGAGGVSPAVAKVLSGLGPLMSRVEDAYRQNDRDLALKALSLELSSQDLTASNTRLRN